MTKKASKLKFKEKPMKMAALQKAYLEVEDPKFLKRREKAEKDYKLTLFIPSQHVSLRAVGDKTLVFVRDTRNGHGAKWRPFHNASPAVDRLQAFQYVGITAPLSAWRCDGLEVADRIMASDLPGGRDYRSNKTQKVAA